MRYGLSHDMPYGINQETGEKEMLAVPADPNAVEGLIDDCLCLNCRYPVKVDHKDGVCTECGKTDFLAEGDHCPKCKQGVIEEDKEERVWF